MRRYTLRTKRVVNDVWVVAVVESLSELYRMNYGVFVDLVNLYRHAVASRELRADSLVTLLEMGLIDDEGRALGGVIAEIVLAAVADDAGKLSLVSPVIGMELVGDNGWGRKLVFPDDAKAILRRKAEKSSLYDGPMFESAHKVIDIVFECAKLRDDLILQDLRITGDDSMVHNCRSDGFMLLCLNGRPCRMVTPWGVWYFTVQEKIQSTRDFGAWLELWPELTRRLGLVRCVPWGKDVGECYLVHMVDDLHCPANYGRVVCDDDGVDEAALVWKILQERRK